MLEKDNFPRHIAIIMDGNGRWAKKRNLPRIEGHRVGINNIREIIKAAEDLDIGFMTFFAFSTENWKRPRPEVNMLMRSLQGFLRKELADFQRRNIRFMVIGRDKPIPQGLLKDLKKAQDLTKNNSGLTVVLAFNYGGRAEIADTARDICRAFSEKKLSLAQIDEKVFADFLYAPGIPEPDLLIRTSGEERISNFLLWQLAYCELYFTKTYWPDFKRADLMEAIKAYQSRDRRFGDINKGS